MQSCLRGTGSSPLCPSFFFVSFFSYRGARFFLSFDLNLLVFNKIKKSSMLPELSRSRHHSSSSFHLNTYTIFFYPSINLLLFIRRQKRSRLSKLLLSTSLHILTCQAGIYRLAFVIVTRLAFVIVTITNLQPITGWH